ncbi:universal stress protein [Natribaculum luteum]|uniref:Universal stress protein n=1 Tax=Natribaculum luteum TaxID=1586232 RepID=A0ABD5P2I3_9EURY|nr:universal stress protein [Natribaculum luteum]
MYTVVVGIDTDADRARALAEELLAFPGDDVTAVLVHSFDENPEGASIAQVGAVRRAQEILEEAGIEVTLEEGSGDPASVILEVADEHDADLIAVAGRKRSPAGKAVFGSVTQDVILGTDRSVLVATASE